MNKAKAIKQIDLAKQRVDEGIKSLRQHINRNVLPEVEESVVVTGLIKRAKRLLVLANREVNAKLEEAKARVINPIVKHKLDPKKVYKPGKKLLSPCLIPTFGFNKRITEENAEAFADRFAEEGWGNHMRIFVAGSWEPFWQGDDRIYLPYMKSSGKFNLKAINGKHIDCLFRRVDYFAERDIKPMFSLLDNCSTHTGRPGFWSTYWMNGDNNINGTCDEKYSITHWYEYNGLPPYSDPSKERPGMRETGKYLMDWYEFILRKAKERYGKDFLIEIGNEIDARNYYHLMLRKFIDTTLNQGNLNGRVFTSMYHDRFYQMSEGSSVWKSCIPILHGIGSYDGAGLSYQTKKHLIEGYRHGLSQDGCHPMKTVAETRSNVLQILKTDSVLYEGNLRPIFEWKDNDWKNVCGHEDWTLKSLRYELFKAYGDAFSEYLG